MRWRLGFNGVVALLLSLGAPVKAAPDSCPYVEISCAAGEKCEGKRQKLTVNVSGLPHNGPELSFKWCVSAGRIVSGQGTTAVEIDAGDATGEGITVVVIVSGIIKECDPVGSHWMKLSEGSTAPVASATRGRPGRVVIRGV